MLFFNMNMGICTARSNSAHTNIKRQSLNTVPIIVHTSWYINQTGIFYILTKGKAPSNVVAPQAFGIQSQRKSLLGVGRRIAAENAFVLVVLPRQLPTKQVVVLLIGGRTTVFAHRPRSFECVLGTFHLEELALVPLQRRTIALVDLPLTAFGHLVAQVGNGVELLLGNGLPAQNGNTSCQPWTSATGIFSPLLPCLPK